MSPEVHVPDQDKVLEDDVSEHGVRRIHIVRLGSPVDIEEWKAKAPAGVEPFYWFYKIGEEWHFHFAWKVPPVKYGLIPGAIDRWDPDSGAED